MLILKKTVIRYTPIQSVLSLQRVYIDKIEQYSDCSFILIHGPHMFNDMLIMYYL